MQTFFNDIDSIEQLTNSLKSSPSLQCQYCFKSEHFIAHGFIYKQRSMSIKEPVGKRIICCNRYGHQGCGRTVQFNLATKLPSRRYTATALFTFISLLLLGHCVCQAYCRATKQTQSRHAWRWLKQLKQNLMRYRGYLVVPAASLNDDSAPVFKHHGLLLQTLKSLFSPSTHCPCVSFQIAQQQAFI